MQVLSGSEPILVSYTPLITALIAISPPLNSAAILPQQQSRAWLLAQPTDASVFMRQLFSMQENIETRFHYFNRVAFLDVTEGWP
jgi:hypothetical protein